jgi:hypothetical protein
MQSVLFLLLLPLLLEHFLSLLLEHPLLLEHLLPLPFLEYLLLLSEGLSLLARPSLNSRDHNPH